MTLCTTPEEAAEVMKRIDWELVPSRPSEELSLNRLIEQSNSADPGKYDADAHYLLGIERHLADVESKRGDHRRVRKLEANKARNIGTATASSRKSSINLGQFRTFMQRSGELQQYLDQLLIARLPAVLRSARQRKIAEHACRGDLSSCAQKIS